MQVHDSIFFKDFEQAQAVLLDFISDLKNFELLEKAGMLMVDSLQSGGKIISCGNGGSMSDAMHFAEELTGRFRENRPGIAAIAISDPSYISCVANDFGYEEVFARFVQSMGNNHDVLLAISTSGNSKNVLKAVSVARDKGLKVISLTGKNGGELKNCSDVCVNVDHGGYSDRIQEIHIKIIHSLIRFVETNLKF